LMKATESSEVCRMRQPRILSSKYAEQISMCTLIPPYTTTLAYRHPPPIFKNTPNVKGRKVLHCISSTKFEAHTFNSSRHIIIYSTWKVFLRSMYMYTSINEYAKFNNQAWMYTIAGSFNTNLNSPDPLCLWGNFDLLLRPYHNPWTLENFLSTLY
jgi:hypothetical protein